MSKKKTIPKSLKQKYLPSELINDEIDHYISIKSRGDGKSFENIRHILNLKDDFIEMSIEIEDYYE